MKATFAIACLLVGASVFAAPRQDDSAKPTYCLRGEAKLVDGSATVALPDWFEKGATANGRTVVLTCKDGWSPLWSTSIAKGKFTVKTTSSGVASQAFFWEVKAVRADVAALQVEVSKPALDASSTKLTAEVEKLKK